MDERNGRWRVGIETGAHYITTIIPVNELVSIWLICHKAFLIKAFSE